MYSYHQFKHLFYVRYTLGVVYCRLVEIPHRKKSMGASDWRRTWVFITEHDQLRCHFQAGRLENYCRHQRLALRQVHDVSVLGMEINVESPTRSVANATLERQMTS
jgi:hypothetical protein